MRASMMNPYMFAAPPVLTYRDAQSFTANTGPYVTTAIAIGDAADNRLVAVVVHWSSAQTLSSLDIGGVAATIHQQSSGGAGGAAICSAFVPSGTTAVVTATFSGTINRGSIGVWTAHNIQSATPTDSDILRTTTGALSRTLDISPLGVLVAGGTRDSTTAITPTNVTERYDVSVESADRHCGDDYTDTGAGGTRTVTLADVVVIVAGTWR